MEIFNFCLEILEHESKKFKVAVKKLSPSNEDLITEANANEFNFDIVFLRCAYVYRCGTINISFAKECFAKFIAEYDDLMALLFKWKNCPDLTLCSLSIGPAFDYIAFLLAFENYLPKTSLSLFKKVNLISKFGAWRNTANIMQQVLKERDMKPFSSDISFGNIKVIEGEPLENFTQKVREPISNSDVVMMMKSITLMPNDPNSEREISDSLKVLFGALKSDAVLFCIDTEPVTILILDALRKYPGKFLFEPVEVQTDIGMDCPDFCKIRFGCSPVISARGMFFVWQKSY